MNNFRTPRVPTRDVGEPRRPPPEDEIPSSYEIITNFNHQSFNFLLKILYNYYKLLQMMTEFLIRLFMIHLKIILIEVSFKNVHDTSMEKQN